MSVNGILSFFSFCDVCSAVTVDQFVQFEHGVELC